MNASREKKDAYPTIVPYAKGAHDPVYVQVGDS